MTIEVVTGGRDYSNRAVIYGGLNRVHTGPLGPITLLVEGDSTGVDQICGEWADERGIPVIRVPAPWDNLDAPGAVIRKRRDGKLYNVLAGFQRNQEMLDKYGVTHASIFPGGDGTADMFDRVRKAGLPYTIVAPSPHEQTLYSLHKSRLDNEGFWYKPSRRKLAKKAKR